MAAPRPVVDVSTGWPVLDVGRCVHPVTIWATDPTQPADYDSAGPKMAPPRKVANAMASIEILRGAEAMRAGQATAQLYAEIAMWWQPGIESDMQVKTESGRTYIVQTAEDVLERGVVLRLNCLGLR